MGFSSILGLNLSINKQFVRYSHIDDENHVVLVGEIIKK